MNMKENQVYSIKLSSGEELVCKVIEITADSVTVSRPLSVAPGPQGIGLVPSMFTADPQQHIEINTHNVCLLACTDDTVRAKYIEATTGIMVAEKRMIIG